jgi:hypothetical protein
MAWIEPSAAASAANPLTPVTSRRFGLSSFLRPIPIALAVTSLASVALFCGFLAFAKSATTTAALPPTRAEAIVALTGGSSRLSDAIRLLNAGYGRRLFITGVHPQVKDRDIARITPATSSMIDCCVDLDYRALNTHGNALETRKWDEDSHFFEPGAEPTGPDAYPIAVTVYALMRRRPATSRRTRHALQFFDVALRELGAEALPLGFVPLPADVVQDVQKYWRIHAR